ncbi:MAG: DUF1289 domain-containing protein [Gammaproteobacteria bacterium]|nr:DUF1289 domain-containing protein [Gammaproteobacteria bacterium]
MTEVHSPCVRNCCLDQNDICIGCLRTLDEIKDWMILSDNQKLDVLAQCAQRRQLKDK